MGNIHGLKLGCNDSVAVLTEDGAKGDTLCLLDGSQIELKENIPAGHKVALTQIELGETVFKYGCSIGRAIQRIYKGGWTHTHNLTSALGVEWTPQWKYCSPSLKTKIPQRSFMGYRRGKYGVGIRNELWVIPTVSCINDLLRTLIPRYSPAPWIENVRVLAHPYGCSQLGDDFEYTLRALSSLAFNPNAAGVLFVGMGCENLQISYLKERMSHHPNVAYTVLQDEADDERALFSRLDFLAENSVRTRTECPLSDLVVGVKCGGSDAFSSLTANPLVGLFTDYLSFWRGTTLATEIPEMFGAEEAITSRIEEESVFNSFVEMIHWFKNYFTSYNQPVYENPSPGNKVGGITTLEEKSLGAVEKTGSGPVTDVLWYGERATRPGVAIVFSPGNDPVSVTSLAISGAVLTLFTTGRGTPYSSVIPSIKIATNTDLYERKRRWIDFNAGNLLKGEGWDDALSRLVTMVIDVANGRSTCNERLKVGEIGLFKNGVIL
ncbi:UxaA family hydrolase [Aminobacterium mobile]|uniref:UxaA family hydrolase n=1 Tax=Aminobacterium mobile TaxID=81467 RepID=UPI0033145F79